MTLSKFTEKIRKEAKVFSASAAREFRNLGLLLFTQTLFQSELQRHVMREAFTLSPIPTLCVL